MKRAPIPALMWFVVLLLCAYLSIANPANTNDTADTSACDGSVQDCLVGLHLQAEFSTITSSHFGRMLAQTIPIKSAVTGDADHPVCKMYNSDYLGCFPKPNKNGADKNCQDQYYKARNPNNC